MPVLPPKPEGWRLKPSASTAWHSLRTRIVNYIGVLRKKRQELVDTSRDAIRHQLTRVRDAVALMPQEPAQQAVLTSVTELTTNEATIGQARAVLKELNAAIRRQEQHLLQEGRRSYQEWIKESLKAGGGALHHMSNTWGRPLQTLSIERDVDGEPLVEPMAIVAAKAQRWAKL